MKDRRENRGFSPRDALEVVAVWLTLAVSLCLVGISLLNVGRDYRFARGGKWTQGKVTAKEPENHAIVRYSYVVNGTAYAGVGHGGRGNPRFDELNAGDSINVVYEPAAPEKSMMGDPAAQVRTSLTGVLFLALVGPTIVTYNMYSKGWLPVARSRNKRKPAPR